MLHVTCICQALNKVCSHVTEEYDLADTLVHKFINVFQKSLVSKSILELQIEEKLPCFPCLTR